MNEKQILNQTDVANWFGVSRRTIYKWRIDNTGPKFSRLPSGRVVTTRANCEKFLAELGQLGCALITSQPDDSE